MLTELPLELFYHIFSYINNYRDALRLRVTCHVIKNTIDNEDLFEWDLHSRINIDTTCNNYLIHGPLYKLKAVYRILNAGKVCRYSPYDFSYKRDFKRLKFVYENASDEIRTHINNQCLHKMLYESLHNMRHLQFFYFMKKMGVNINAAIMHHDMIDMMRSLGTKNYMWKFVSRLVEEVNEKKSNLFSRNLVATAIYISKCVQYERKRELLFFLKKFPWAAYSK